MADLEHDLSIRLPLVTVLRASAGSGKTFRLTQRFVQFLLSERIPRNAMRNLMALTFSNNASRLMKGKVLEWLKLLALGDPSRLAEMAEVVSGGTQRISRRAAELIETVLDRFSELQVRTIDSFMASLFRASALDFGFGPDLEVVLEPEGLMDYAWDLFLREARAGTPAASLLDQTVDRVLDLSASAGAFPWNVSRRLLGELQRLEGRLVGAGESPIVEDPTTELRRLEEELRGAWEALSGLVERSGLPRRRNSRYPVLLAAVRAGRFTDLVEGSMRNGPVNKPKRRDLTGMAAWEAVEASWQRAAAAADGYAAAWARAWYQPLLRLHSVLDASLDRVKRAQGKLFIDDIGRSLGSYLAAEMVPDVYFRLGERIWHYLVDEFQDTSPLQ